MKILEDWEEKVRARGSLGFPLPMISRAPSPRSWYFLRPLRRSKTYGSYHPMLSCFEKLGQEHLDNVIKSS